MHERPWSASRGLRNRVDRPENEPELWAGQTELGLRPEREVDLRGAGEEQDAISRRSGNHSEVIDRGVDRVQVLSPINDHLPEGSLSSNAED